MAKRHRVSGGKSHLKKAKGHRKGHRGRGKSHIKA